MSACVINIKVVNALKVRHVTFGIPANVGLLKKEIVNMEGHVVSCMDLFLVRLLLLSLRLKQRVKVWPLQVPPSQGPNPRRSVLSPRNVKG